jgi:hypothetical protein
MAHRFAHRIKLDPAGAPLAKGPRQTRDEPIFRIWVWVTQEKSKAAARGSMDFGNNPVARWECTTTLMENSPRFERGPALGMAIALVKKGNAKEYFGWWDDQVVIVKPR